MAFNGNIKRNPWIVNAADVALAAVQVWPPPIDTVNYTIDAIVHPGLVMGLEIEFQEMGVGDVCTINDGGGNLIWAGHGAGDLQTVRSGVLPGPFNGVTIPVGGISNGKVLIYHR